MLTCSDEDRIHLLGWKNPTLHCNAESFTVLEALSRKELDDYETNFELKKKSIRAIGRVFCFRKNFF